MDHIVSRLGRRARAMACMAGCVVLASSAALQAQPLADQVPDDAIAYFGWAGADAAKNSGYEGSHLQAVLSESRVHELFGSYLDALEKQVVDREPDAAEPFRLARVLGAPMWKYPSAIAVERADDISGKNGPPVKAIIISKAGGDAQRLADEWSGLIAQAKAGDAIVHVVANGEYVVATLGYKGEPANLPNGTNGLSHAAGFIEAMKLAGVTKSPMMVGYFDAEAAIKLLEDGVATNPSATQPGPDGRSGNDKVKAFLDNSGLRGVKHVVGSAGFDGKDWVTTRFVHAPGPRQGLLSAWPDGQVDAALLKTVPADASFYASVRFDPAVFIRQMQQTLSKTDDQALRGFNMGIGAVQAAAGTNVLVNVLEPMGPDWVFYNSAHVGTSSITGMVAVNKPEDPEKLRKALNAMSVSLANWANVGLDRMDMVNQAQSESGVGGIRAQQLDVGGAKVTYLTTPFISPAWAIEDGKLFLGFYPQTVGSAVRQAKKGGPSLVDSDKYKQTVARLGVAQPGTVSFMDLPAVAPHSQMYTTLLFIGRYVGIADLFGPPLPEPLLPPFDVLMDHLSPAVSASWHDEAGWHNKSVMSFPGSELLTEQGALATVGGPGGAAIGAGILLPSLNRAREQANRVRSASNLRQIGMGCLMYANENKGSFPADFGELVKTQDLTADIFVDPRSDTELPPDARTGDKAQAFVTDHADYVYLGKGLKTKDVTAETIIAYEKTEGQTDGVNILFGDGHVEFVPMWQATEQIEEAKKARGIE